MLSCLTKLKHNPASMGSNADGPLARTAAGQSLGGPWSSTGCAWRNGESWRTIARLNSG